MKVLGYVLVIIAFMLVTFFGMGPVLLADGSTGERMVTLFVVLGLYVFLAWLILRIRKR